MNESMITKERYYDKNRRVFLWESFFVTFSFSIFSQTTILPVYVSNITENRFWISMLTFLFFGLSNLSSVFSAIIGANAKSPKRTAVIICGLQRVSQFMIWLSTFYLSGSVTMALAFFFAAYAFYSISAGMASPVFSNMVSHVIYKNVSSFYGSYSLIGALSGVITAQLIRLIEQHYGFPVNYRILFLIGVVMAVVATLIVIFGVKEVPEREERKKLHLKDFPALLKNILKNNQSFRRVLLIRIFMAIAECAVPFFILRVGMIEGIGSGYIGGMTTALLLFNLIFSKWLGAVGSKKGPAGIAGLGCIAGACCSGLALFINSPFLAYVLFAFVSLATLSTQLSNQVAVIIHSEKGLVPVYVAVSGLCIAPFYALSSILGGVIVERFGYFGLFSFALLFYFIGILYALRFGQLRHDAGRN